MCPGDPGLSLQAPQLLQDARNSTVLSNSVLGAFLQSGRVAGLSHPVEIQFWHNMVLVSRAPPRARARGSPVPVFPLELGKEKVSPLCIGTRRFLGSLGSSEGPQLSPSVPIPSGCLQCHLRLLAARHR